MRWFWTFYWVLWFGMLVVGDPIASWLGAHYHIGDQLTDTHFLATYINYGLRIAALAWLGYHFLVAHRSS